MTITTSPLSFERVQSQTSFFFQSAAAFFFSLFFFVFLGGFFSLSFIMNIKKMKGKTAPIDVENRGEREGFQREGEG